MQYIKTGLSYDAGFMNTRRLPLKQQIVSVISDNLVLTQKLFWLNRLLYSFIRNISRKPWSIWFFFVRQFSIMIETYRISPGHWWLLGSFAGVLRKQTYLLCFFTEILKLQSCKLKKHQLMIVYVFQKYRENFAFQIYIILQ